jgi:predicted transposase YdaD
MAYVAGDKEALRAYQMRAMAMSDWTSGINHARREGMEKGLERGLEKGMERGLEKGRREGIQEGRREGLREIAAKMKRRGVPVDQIAEDTGLSAEDIAGL